MENQGIKLGKIAEIVKFFWTFGRESAIVSFSARERLLSYAAFAPFCFPKGCAGILAYEGVFQMCFGFGRQIIFVMRRIRL